MTGEKLFLVDATALCYRAFYAIRSLATSSGQPTGAIYGFINIFHKILKDNNPKYLAVCFDVSRETFRQKKFADYKIQRPPMPDDLSSQISFIKRIVSAYGITILEKEGFEADDVIATMVEKAKKIGLSSVIISADKDMLQLVDNTTSVISPGKDDIIVYDAGKVLERFDINPERITDLIALMGDSVDNIPGVPGIGEKTAVELLKEHGSLDNLLNNLNGLKQEKLKKSIQENIERITLNKELAVLDKNVDIDFNLESFKIKQEDTKELYSIFRHLEFKKLLKELAIEPDVQGLELKIEEIDDNKLKDFIGTSSELYLWGQDLKSMLYCVNDKYFSVSNPGKNLKEILENESIVKISHDLKKIKVSLARDNINLKGLSFDVMLASYLINPSSSNSELVNVAWEHLGEIRDALSLDNSSLLNLIVRLKPILEEKLHTEALYGLFNDVDMPLAEVLAYMEICGIKLDTEILNKLSIELEQRLIKLIKDIYDLSGVEFNINSPKQLREILFEKLKLPVVKRSKTGPSTDEEVLKKLAPQHKLPALLLEYRQLTKLKNTYIDALPKLVNPKTNRVHSCFNQTGTETGRLSSSNPNLQNIPVKTDIGKKIRQAVVAFDEKSLLLSCDYSQVELRILAHLSGDSDLIAAFKKNADIHKISASLIYGVAENEVTQEMREMAKRVNFGIVYGLSSYGLARDLTIPQEEAQAFIDAYFNRYSKVKDYIKAQIKNAQRDGYVSTILGRRRYIPEIKNKNQAIRQFAERQAANTPIQGSASDLIKLAMINILHYIEEKKMQAQMILQIHDELLFNVPNSEEKDFVKLVKDKMENVLRLAVPIVVDIKRGRNWLEMEEVR